MQMTFEQMLEEIPKAEAAMYLWTGTHNGMDVNVVFQPKDSVTYYNGGDQVYRYPKNTIVSMVIGENRDTGEWEIDDKFTNLKDVLETVRETVLINVADDIDYPAPVY